MAKTGGKLWRGGGEMAKAPRKQQLGAKSSARVKA